MTGYIGLVLLLGAYGLLLTRWSKYFIPVDIVASFVLTIHAIAINDFVFSVVNGLITVMLTVKYLRNETV